MEKKKSSYIKPNIMTTRKYPTEEIANGVVSGFDNSKSNNLKKDIIISKGRIRSKKGPFNVNENS